MFNTITNNNDFYGSLSAPKQIHKVHQCYLLIVGYMQLFTVKNTPG